PVPYFPCRSSVSLAFVVLVFYHCTPIHDVYTLSLHDALPISIIFCGAVPNRLGQFLRINSKFAPIPPLQITVASGFCTKSSTTRSEEHTSELQSRFDLVCRLLLEKKNNIYSLYTESHDLTISF